MHRADGDDYPCIVTASLRAVSSFARLDGKRGIKGKVFCTFSQKGDQRVFCLCTMQFGSMST